MRLASVFAEGHEAPIGRIAYLGEGSLFAYQSLHRADAKRLPFLCKPRRRCCTRQFWACAEETLEVMQEILQISDLF